MLSCAVLPGGADGMLAGRSHAASFLRILGMAHTGHTLGDKLHHLAIADMNQHTTPSRDAGMIDADFRCFMGGLIYVS
jgi:hypothetical protein